MRNDQILWSGRPWITPRVAWRTLLAILLFVVLFALEIFANVSGFPVLGIGLTYWTILLVIVAWVASILHLVILRASHRYLLRNDSLEIRTGILTSRTSVISPSGFSDLDVTQSILGRLIGSGSITIRTQSETKSERRMVMVRHPLNVADDIRDVMARPLVRVDKS